TPAPTLWSTEAVVIDLGEPRLVERVVFEVSDADWVARPRVAVSTDGRAWMEVDATASLADATLSLMTDPQHGRGEVRFAPQTARFIRLNARLPARAGTLEFR